jgi:hypothetical protein
MKPALICLLALAPAGATFGAETPQQAFVKGWEGRTVTLKTTLYSLIYTERGKLGTTRRGLREGLIVATPTQGAYFQFDGRQGRGDLTGHDPRRFVAAVNTAYEADALDVRSYRKLEAMGIERYDPGIELRLSAVRVEADQVRLEFARDADAEAVTDVRIKWPVPLTKLFTERALVEDVIRRLIAIKGS